MTTCKDCGYEPKVGDYGVHMCTPRIQRAYGQQQAAANLSQLAQAQLGPQQNALAQQGLSVTDQSGQLRQVQATALQQAFAQGGVSMGSYHNLDDLETIDQLRARVAELEAALKLSIGGGNHASERVVRLEEGLARKRDECVRLEEGLADTARRYQEQGGEMVTLRLALADAAKENARLTRELRGRR